MYFQGTWHGAHGVVVSHPLRMRKALGSIPSVSIFAFLFHILGSIENPRWNGLRSLSLPPGRPTCFNRLGHLLLTIRFGSSQGDILIGTKLKFVHKHAPEKLGHLGPIDQHGSWDVAAVAFQSMLQWAQSTPG